MMKYKALVSFSGLISMAEGEVREIEDPAIVNDLLKAGYIQPAERWTAEQSSDLPKLRLASAGQSEPLTTSANTHTVGQPRPAKPAKEEVKKTKKGGKKKGEN